MRASTRRVSNRAFPQLFDRRAEDFLRFFPRRTLLVDVAAELTAESFAKAFASRANFDTARGSPDEWLFGIANHELSHYWRRDVVDSRAPRKLGIRPAAVHDEDYDRVEELIDFQILARKIGPALERLPSDQRDAAVLRVVDELPYREIAIRRGCSEQAARARVSRGLRTLGASSPRRQCRHYRLHRKRVKSYG
jgi:RNA polymerase sigma-70 factor (ECF subfamily)